MAADMIKHLTLQVPGSSSSDMQDVTISEDSWSQSQSVLNGEDADSDNEDEDSKEEAQKISDRRRKQNDVFKSWMATRSEKVAKEEYKTMAMNANDELLSIRSLMAKQESKVIIEDPRAYQRELFERAKNNNIIAVLDTGSGKTLIAVMLLRHCMDQELERRAKGLPRRISFFLVHSVALVFQQFAVLECNLDQPIERFCGAMNVDTFSKKLWRQYFEDNMAIVCTADILLTCLLNSFIAMDEINLLIFDEAHKTKKNHAYARIIKDFYVNEPLKSRPKVFGMTASPVDAKVDVVEAANGLETLLHCRIATVSDPKLIQESVSKPKEQILTYQSPAQPHLTPLGETLKQTFNDIRLMDRIFTSATIICSELGEWAADYLWKVALAEEETERLQRRVERTFSADTRNQEMTVLDNEIKLIKEARAVVESFDLCHPMHVPNGISDKAERLRKFLDKMFELPNESRCIVFVTTRYTARLLAALYKIVGNKNQRIGFLIGTRSGEPGDISVSVREQMLTITKFRKGDLNILFATSIAEEGLDIPDCNYVVRFDLYTTLIQYIQSRGRARHRNSCFISMIEANNPEHRRIINEVRANEDIMRTFCMALPQDRLLQGNEHDLEDALAKEKHLPIYKEPETGAKLTFGSALARIEHFVGSLRLDDETTPKASYIMTYDGKKFLCELVLPPNSPVRSVIGNPYPRKSLAKRSAAFEACLLLRADGHIDEHLLPRYHKELPAMRNAHLALSSKKSKHYERRVKPTVWEDSRGLVPSSLYVIAIDLEDLSASSRPFAPLALLSRTPLIDFPAFPLFPKPGVSSNVICKKLDVALQLPEHVLRLLENFTLRVYADLYHKIYEPNTAAMSYWLAPCHRRSGPFRRDMKPEDIIDWDVLEHVLEDKEPQWSNDMPEADLLDRFLVDRWDGGRRFFTRAVDHTKKPLDNLPPGCPTHKWMGNILDYSVSLWAKQRPRLWETLDKNQPVLEVDKVLHRHNLLDDWTEADMKAASRCYVCPQPLMISAIPITVAVACYMFPAILHRLESYLIAQELCNKLGLVVKTDLALEAITKDSDNTEEHRAEQIQFQRGMGKNYERLEFIGDCFLKMATSIALYAANAKDDEFYSHVKRMLMICNKNLFNTAMDLSLYKYIRGKGFSRRTWYPEGLVLKEGKGKGTEPVNFKDSHPLNDKSIADVCEALIGASLLSAENPEDMDMAVKSVTKMVNNSLFTEVNDHQATKFSDYITLYVTPEWQTLDPSAAHINLVDQCAKEDPGYRFEWPRLLKAAFTHPSTPFIWEKIPCYQRLEFLGDALFDMACVRFLYERHPDRDPQWLTEHKMAMVSNKFLGAVCVRLGFHKHMRHLNTTLGAQIAEYVTDITEAEATSNGARDYWMNTRNPPKCLPDIVEAYMGALFVDSKFQYKQAERFFETHIRWFFEDMSIYDSFANAHPTTHLSNLLSTSLGCTDFRLLCHELPTLDGRAAENPRIVAAVMVHNKIIADSEGTSSRYAKIRASQLAVEELQGMIRFSFVARFKCDCKEMNEAASEPSQELVDTAI